MFSAASRNSPTWTLDAKKSELICVERLFMRILWHLCFERRADARAIARGTSKNRHILAFTVRDEFFCREVSGLVFDQGFCLRFGAFFGMIGRFFRVFRPISQAPHAPLLSSVTQRLKLYTHARRMVCDFARTLPMQRNVFPDDCHQSPKTCSTRARILDRAWLRS